MRRQKPTPLQRVGTSLNSLGATLRRWFDSSMQEHVGHPNENRTDWLRVLPFVILHLGCFAVLWTGASTFAVVTAIVLYVVRMFAITGFYHRYFSHKTFRTGRVRQFLFALLGSSACQRGPLWWAAHHRRHHRYSDTERDVHSPHVHGLLWSHMGWFTSQRNFATDMKAIPDLARYPELRFLDRYDTLVPLTLGAGLFGLGALLERFAPELGTSGLQLFVWGFVVSTVVLFHATCTINSLAHCIGRRPYDTGDQSRNSLLLALLTLGEGWHNNHHYYPKATRQGFVWWQIDITYYGLRALAALRVISDLQPVPLYVRRARHSSS